MRLHVRLALLAAALSAAGVLGACQARLPVADTPAPATTTPAATATPATPPGGVEVALANVDWPQGQAVAVVNGTEIKTDAWRAEVDRQLRLVTDQFQVDWNDQANLAHLPEILDTVLSRMVDMELVRQMAEQEGVTVSAEELQQTGDRAKEQILADGRYADIEAYLQASNLSQEQFDALIREQATIDKMLVAHGGPSEVEQVHARHILVNDEATAQEVLAHLAANESFEDLAKTYSTDPTNKDQGGDLGWFPRGAMVPEFEQAAFALQPGETSGIVTTTFGYHIIRLDERGVRALEEPMLSQMREQNFVSWLDEQRSGAQIELLYHAQPTEPTP